MHKLMNESVMYMYDECTMDVEIKVLIIQWVLSNTYLICDLMYMFKELDSSGFYVNGNFILDTCRYMFMIGTCRGLDTCSIEYAIKWAQMN